MPEPTPTPYSPMVDPARLDENGIAMECVTPGCEWRNAHPSGLCNGCRRQAAPYSPISGNPAAHREWHPATKPGAFCIECSDAENNVFVPWPCALSGVPVGVWDRSHDAWREECLSLHTRLAAVESATRALHAFANAMTMPDYVWDRSGLTAQEVGKRLNRCLSDLDAALRGTDA